MESCGVGGPGEERSPRSEAPGTTTAPKTPSASLTPPAAVNVPWPSQHQVLYPRPEKPKQKQKLWQPETPGAMSVPVTLPHSTVSATMDLPAASAAPKVLVPTAVTVVIPETEAVEGVMDGTCNPDSSKKHTTSKHKQ